VIYILFLEFNVHSLALNPNDKLAKFQELDENEEGLGEIHSLKSRIPSGDSLSSLNVQMGSDDESEDHDNENHEADFDFEGNFRSFSETQSFS
jgi:hypothetical protein